MYMWEALREADHGSLKRFSRRTDWASDPTGLLTRLASNSESAGLPVIDFGTSVSLVKLRLLSMTHEGLRHCWRIVVFTVEATLRFETATK